MTITEFSALTTTKDQDPCCIDDASSRLEQSSSDNKTNYSTFSSSSLSSSSLSQSTDSLVMQDNDGRQTTNSSDCCLVAMKKEISVDEAVDALGYGRFQNFILLAAGLSFAADAMEVTLLSFLSIILKSEWNLSESEAASVTSCVFAGAMAGTLILGRAGDDYGRRPVYLFSAGIISVFGVMTSYLEEFWMLLVVRFMVGFGVGGLTVAFDIFAEFLPTNKRGRRLLLIEYFWTAGSLLVPMVAYLTIGSGRSWNLFVQICATPCVASFVLGIWLVPESPRWLVSRGRKEEAMEVFRRAALVNGRNWDDLFKGSVVELKDEEVVEESSYAELFSPQLRRLTIPLWGVWLAFGFTYYGVIMATTRIFEHEESLSPTLSSASTSSVPTFDFEAIFISCSAEIIGTTIVIIGNESMGRVRSQTYYYALGGICVLAFCLSPDTDWGVGCQKLFAFSARIFEMAATCMTWVATTEVLSTEIRATGHSAANAVARIGAFICPYIVQGNFSLPTIGIIMFIIHAFAVACVLQLPETKGKAMGVHCKQQRDNVPFANDVLV